MTSWRHNSWR